MKILSFFRHRNSSFWSIPHLETTPSLESFHKLHGEPHQFSRAVHENGCISFLKPCSFSGLPVPRDAQCSSIAYPVWRTVIRKRWIKPWKSPPNGPKPGGMVDYHCKLLGKMNHLTFRARNICWSFWRIVTEKSANPKIFYLYISSHWFRRHPFAGDRSAW